MGIIGLDLSVTSTGISKVSFDKKATVFYTTAVTVGALPKKKEDAVPYWKRYEAVASQVLQHVKDDDVVFIEDYVHLQSLAMLAELGGLTKFLIWRRTGTWPIAISAQSRIAFAVGPGMKGVKKEDVKLGVYKKDKKEFNTNDECDAFVLMQIGMVAMGLQSPMISKRKWLEYEKGVVSRLMLKSLKPRAAELQSLAIKMDQSAKHLDKR